MGAYGTLLLAQEYDGGGGGLIGALFGGACIFVWIAVIVVMFAGLWKMFEKARKPGWAAIVPIYNAMVLAEIAGKPQWWGLTVLCGPVWFIMSLLICIDLAKRFGKETGFAIGLWLLGPIFFLILGFGDAKYQGGSSSS